MYQIAQIFALRLILAFTICASLLLPGSSFLTEIFQGQSAERTTPQPTHKRPEGIWPNLEDVKDESRVGREAPLPIPSTLRSPKLSEKPWDGRRVGDPETTQRHLDQALVIDK